MAGGAKSLDKFEDKSRRNPLLDALVPGSSSAGMMKKLYGDKRGVDTKEGYLEGKEQKLTNEADEAAAKQDAEAKAAQAAAEVAALDKAHQSQKDALKRKGRKSSILTSSQGVADPLGVPGA